MATPACLARRGDLLECLLHVELALEHHALHHEAEEEHGVQRAPQKLGGFPSLQRFVEIGGDGVSGLLHLRRQR